MMSNNLSKAMLLALRWLPVLFLAVVLICFGSLSPRFLDPANLGAILFQASWLITLALGMNFVLLSAGVDLSAGSVMYLATVVIGLLLPGYPIIFWPIAACLVGALVGCMNAALIVNVRLPSFIATLALSFIARGAGLFLSETQMIFADTAIADWGRASIAGLPWPLGLCLLAFIICFILLRTTRFGIYLLAVGADAEGARRAGLPRAATQARAFILSGALAGLAGFILFAQTSAATAAFGINAEFLAIAAAVLGGTSLFGGRGSIWAPVIGAILITTVQNGLVLIDANPYAYPVVTGGVIFLAAMLDSLRVRLVARLERRPILERTA